MVTANNEINDDMTTKVMIKEAIYVINGLEAEHIKVLVGHPELMARLSTTKEAARELLWGYGVWIPKLLAPYTLKGIVDAIEILRKELEKLRKKKIEESSRILRTIDRLSRLARWIVSKIGK